MSEFVEGLDGDTARLLLASAELVGAAVPTVEVTDNGFNVTDETYAAYLIAIKTSGQEAETSTRRAPRPARSANTGGS